MLSYFISKIQKPLAVLMIVSILVISVPQRTYAILGAGDTVVVVGDVSVTGIANNISHTMDRLKSFVFDRLSTLIAKQILHQMTVSVINWINTGFEGSPAFLTNPEAFFLDVADQITGAYLATDGPLSSLCSPFSIDVRLSLALSKTAFTDQRYTCTLGKIIQAQKNGPDITVNGQVINSSMNGFLGGDFNQGGWPAFVALTTEPQNNPYGAFLYAQSDLNAKIGQRQNRIQADIQLGNGFMSWESCKDIPGGTNVDLNDEAQIEKSKTLPNNPGVKQTQNADGTFTFKQCETQTPGSVIANTLQTNLDVPVVELELANDINAVINALVNKMITTMLSEGLGALSGGGSGGGASYTQQLLEESNAFDEAAASTAENLQAQMQPVIDQTIAYKVMYDQALNAAQGSKQRYLTARTCYEIKIQNQNFTYRGSLTTAQNMLNKIDETIRTQIDPQINDLIAKKKNAEMELKDIEDLSYSMAGTGSAENVKKQADRYSLFVQNGGTNVQPRVDAAQSTLDATMSLVEAWNNDAAQMQRACDNSINGAILI